MNKKSRMALYNKDIQRLTGRSYRYACKLAATIKASLGKTKHQLISVQEFCQYMGWSEGDVYDRLE